MKYTFKTAALLLLASVLATSAYAQETWSLERCILYAQENNLSVKQAQANVKTALLSERQAKTSRLPNLGANFSAGEQFGRTIDPTTNQYSTVATGYNSIGVSAGINLFQGGLIHHSVKQAAWNAQAAQADADQTTNTLALQIAQAYLNILLFEEQLKNARERIATSTEQLNATQKLIDAGTLPAADRYNILAQIAQGEQAAVQAQNSVDLAYLSLKQLLQLEPDYDLLIERPAIAIPADAAPDAVTLTPIYTTALGTQPNVRAADYRIKSAEEGISIAKSSYWPTVSFGVNLNTNYSTAFKLPAGYNQLTEPPIPVRIDGEDRILQIIGQKESIPYDIRTVEYFDQIDQNFGQSVGLNINIPIYQNGRVRLNVERARLSVLTAQLQQNQVRQQLKNDIQTAIANARAARKQLDAAQKTFDATKIAFENTEKRHALGAVNTLDLTTARNNLDIAENDLTVAKYDYLFKLKILDFYEGKPLTMN
ncbi:MAG: TolC family protein [Haliscomenobacteraceae bacterium CHB4]|nr:Outer membrane efflux protein BepC [Saprospiraceae bacterium]MCE7922206.1 TolC family protein [Haliscomenobacteraceae bacterium CHB4]